MLSDIDKEIVHLPSEHRVITTQQFHKLLGVPERTVRYRLERLRSLRIAGRSSIYVERGRSAFHWWPTRLADSYHRGEPVPRSGERDEPNQLFLRHAAGLTGIYLAVVQLCESSGLAIHSWLREVEAKQDFLDGSRETAIVPDVSMILGTDAAEYHAFIELDMGTMSLPRLGRKLRAYAAYGRRKAWRARHPFVPPLLFMTTSWRRAEAVLRAFEAKCRMVERDLHPSSLLNPPERITIAVCSEAATPETAFSEPVWMDSQGRDGIPVIELLDRCWAQWSRAEAQRKAAEQQRHQRQLRLCCDPEARRRDIQERKLVRSFAEHLENLDPEHRKALQIVLESEAPMSRAEKEAFRFFEHRVRPDGDGEARSKPIEVTGEEKRALEALRVWSQNWQQRHLAEMYRRFPHSASLLRSIRKLQRGSLLNELDLGFLEQRIEGDRTVTARQAQDLKSYLAWRTEQVDKNVAQKDLLGRLRSSKEQEARAIDLEQLRYCEGCEQIAVSSTQGELRSFEQCPFCCGGLMNLGQAVSEGLAVPDERGFWAVCHPPMPDWVAPAGLRSRG